MAVILCLLLHLASPLILCRLITSDEIYQAVIHYLDWRSFGLLFSFPFLAFRSFLVGITTTKALSVAAIMAICINIPFNYLLIFKLNLGISGAAMASSLAEFGAFIVLLLYMWVRVDKVKYGLKVVYDGKVLIKVVEDICMEYASLFCQRCSLVSVLRCYRASGKDRACYFQYYS